VANSRFYSSTAQQATLTGGASSSDTSIAVSSTAGFPGSTPYTLALDYGSSNEELVEVTNVASLTLTITRAIDGTSASGHAVGAFVRHVSSARDFTDSRTHEASTAAHGATGAVVGTTNSQTLTNKTLTKALGSLQNITMFNAGALGITTIIGDSVNPSASRLEIKDNEIALNTMVFFQATGTIKSVRNTGDTEGAYKFRVTDNDAVTDRIAILSGGTIGFTPTAATTFPAVDIIAPNTSVTQRSVRLAASGGGTERFTIFNDGHTIIAGTAAAQNQLTVKAATSQSVDTFRVTDSSSNTLLSVQSTGVTLANKGMVIAQPGVTSGAVLQVGGSNVGYTGNLEQWVGPANTIVASLNESGTMTVQNLVVNGVNSINTAWKTADTSRTSTTTNTNDPDIAISVVANATYAVDGFLLFSADTAGDLKIGWTAPAGATFPWTATGQPAAATTGTGTVITNAQTLSSANYQLGGLGTGIANAMVAQVRGLLTIAGTGGSFNLQWSQVASSANATVMHAGTHVTLRRIA